MIEPHIFGLCDNDTVHAPHLHEQWGSIAACPGQFVICRNCDDRKCMSCVFREVHDRCEDDCPNCCKVPA